MFKHTIHCVGTTDSALIPAHYVIDEDLRTMISGMENLFGERLREERERLGLTQAKLAVIMGVKHLAIGQYEREQSKPNLNALYRLLDHGFNLQYLVFGRENVPKPRQIPDHVFNSIENSIRSLQSKLSSEPMADEIHYKVFLLLLDDYFEDPTAPVKTGRELIELMVRSV